MAVPGAEGAEPQPPGDAAIELYCICRRPYDGRMFMIECDACHMWLHGVCVGLQEAEAVRLAKYMCPECERTHGPSILKENTRRSQRSRSSRNYAEVENGIQLDENRYTRALDARPFPSLDVPELCGDVLTRAWVSRGEFTCPVLVRDPTGLDMRMPPATFTVDDVIRLVGGDRPMHVIEVASQQEIEGYNLYQFAYYFKHPSVRRRILNVISLEVTGTPLAAEILRPKVVRDLDWLDRVWPPNDPVRPKAQLYCLMGVGGCYTDFHIDFGGSSVFYHVVRGKKIFYFIPPTPENLRVYERWSNSPTQSDTFLADLMPPGACRRVAIETGQTLFIPSGWIHAVFTPEDTLVFGGNFIHDFAVPLQIEIARIEARTHVPPRFRFPFFRRAHWHAAVDLVNRLEQGAAHQHGPLTEAEKQSAWQIVVYLNNIMWRKGESQPPKPLETEDADTIRFDEMPSNLWGSGSELLQRLRNGLARAGCEVDAVPPPNPEAEGPSLALVGDDGELATKEQRRRRRRTSSISSPAKRTKRKTVGAERGGSEEAEDTKPEPEIEQGDTELPVAAAIKTEWQ